MEKTYLSSDENKLSPDLIDKNCTNYFSITWIVLYMYKHYLTGGGREGVVPGPLCTHVCAN